jgi:hypothetical protein
MVRQEIYGYLLTHHAISALICRAATEADIDPDRVTFKRTVRLVRAVASPTRRPFPDQQKRSLQAAMADITKKSNLNPKHRHCTYPRVVKRARHNSYRVKRPTNIGTRHHSPPTIQLANLSTRNPRAA